MRVGRYLEGSGNAVTPVCVRSRHIGARWTAGSPRPMAWAVNPLRGRPNRSSGIRSPRTQSGCFAPSSPRCSRAFPYGHIPVRAQGETLLFAPSGEPPARDIKKALGYFCGPGSSCRYLPVALAGFPAFSLP